MPNPLERNICALKEHLGKAFGIEPHLIVDDRTEITWLLGTLARLRVPVDIQFQVTSKQQPQLFLFEPLAATSVKAVSRHNVACDNGDGCDIWELLEPITLYGVRVEVERLHNLLRFTPDLRLPTDTRELLPSPLPPLPLPGDNHDPDAIQ